MSSLYKKYMKVMAYGGSDGVDYSNLQAGVGAATSAAISSFAGPAAPAIQGIQQIGSGIVDAINPPDQYGVQSDLASLYKGNLQGGTIGMVLGYLANQKAKNREKQMIYQNNLNKYQQEQNYSNAAISFNPALVTGHKNGQIYSNGGGISYNGYHGQQFSYGGMMYSSGGGIHIKPSHRGRFTAYLKRTGKTLTEALHSSSPHVRQMANFARNAKKWHHESGGPIDAPLSRAYLNGGTASSLSSSSSVINGPSHASGGVDIPQLGVQVEGGETTMGNFVFSHKLGFAQQHKPIARAIGKIEEKPMTPDRVNALRKLKTREANLAMSQEYFKHLNGIQ